MHNVPIFQSLLHFFLALAEDLGPNIFQIDQFFFNFVIYLSFVSFLHTSQYSTENKLLNLFLISLEYRVISFEITFIHWIYHI